MSSRYAVCLSLILMSLSLVGCSRRDPLEESQRLVQQFDYAGARKILEPLVEKDSTNVEAMAMLLKVLWLGNDSLLLKKMESDFGAGSNPYELEALSQFYFFSERFQEARRVLDALERMDATATTPQALRASIMKAEQATLAYVQARAFIGQGEMDSAFTSLHTSDSLWAVIGHPRGRARTLNLQSVVRGELGEIPQAEEALAKARSLSASVGDRTELARCYLLTGALHLRKGEIPESIEWYSRADSLGRIVNDRRIVMSSLGQLAQCQMTVGDLLSAKRNAIEVLAYQRETGIQRDENIMLHMLGDITMNLGDPDEAHRYYSEAHALAVKRHDLSLQASALAGITAVHHLRGESETAAKAILQAIELYRQTGQKRNRAACMELLTDIYYQMGQYDRALASIEQTIALAQDVHANDMIISSTYRQARVYAALGNEQKAAELCESVISQAQRIQDYSLSMDAAFLLLECYDKTKRYPSTALLDSLYYDLKRRGYTIKALDAQLLVAKLNLETGNLSGALEAVNMVLAKPEARHSIETLARAHELEGDILAKQMKQQQAAQAYQKALLTYELLTPTIRSLVNRATHFDRLRQLFEKRVLVSLRVFAHDSVFVDIEKMKSRTFLTLLSRQTPLRAAAGDSALAAERNLRARYSEASALASAIHERSSEQTRLIKIADYASNLQEAQSAYSQFLYQQELNNPRLSSILSVPYITVQDIRPLIPTDAVLLDYVLLDDRIITCGLKRKGELRIFTMLYPRDRLRIDVSTLRGKMLRTKTRDVGWEKLAEHLERILLDSVKASGLLAGVNRLIIVPDDVLHYLPFQLLSDGKQSLTERFAIVNYPSAGVMKLLKQLNAQPSARKSYLAMAYSGGSLSYADAEVNAIANEIGPIVTRITGKATTRDTLKALCEKFDVLHFAVHGISNSQDPLLGALLLAPTKSDDGRLYVHEVFNLKLKNALVVLSACETGVEKAYQRGISPGGEVIGLTRAFLFAGASGVVSTLWKVDDRASMEFMRKFYRHLATTNDVPLALSLAQREVRAMPQYQHPYYWAPYVVTGF